MLTAEVTGETVKELIGISKANALQYVSLYPAAAMFARALSFINLFLEVLEVERKS